MSSFTRLLLEKGIDVSQPSGTLPHRSRKRAEALEAPSHRGVPNLDTILAQLDKEDVSEVEPRYEHETHETDETCALSSSTKFTREDQKKNPRKPYYDHYDPHFSEASSAAQRRSEAFENIKNQSLREDAHQIVRQKPRSAETRKPSHWNFSFNVNREVVGAELLEIGEDGELQPPVQDPKALPRTGKGKAEPLPGLPGLRQGPLRMEPGLARFRAIPGHNEWVAGLQKMAEANRPEHVVPKTRVPVEEFVECGSPLEKRPFRCLRSEVAFCSVNCLCDDWKY